MNNQKPFRGAQIDKTHPLSKGLVCCLIFNEKTGNLVYDLSNNNNNGTINGPDWVTEGLDFVTANNDYITIGDRASLDISGDHTIIASINTSTNTIRQGIYGKYLSPTFSIRGAGGDPGELAYYNTNTGWKYSTGAIDNNLFSSVGVVVDANAGGNFYIDGQDAGGSWVDATTGLTPNNNDAEIGRDYALYTLDGILSYVYIYNRALAPWEISWLNREPYVMFERPILNTALLTYYQADEAGVPNPGALMMMLMRR